MRRVATVPVWQKEEMREHLYKYLKELLKYDKSIKIDEFNNPEYKYFPYYFQDDDRYPFMFYIDDAVSGLALVRKIKNKHHEIAEFYVLKEYRKDNNSMYFAARIASMFEGVIEFSSVENNKRAVAFWDKFSSRFNNPKREVHRGYITWYVENTKPAKKKKIKH